MLKNTTSNRGEFSALQQLFAMTLLLLKYSYSLARGFLFCLAAAGLLVLTACAGGSGGSSSGGGSSSPSAFEVELTFAPIPGGFRISNQSDFGDFVVLRITATSGDNVEEEEVKIGDFVNDSYDFTGLLNLDWKFEVIGILSDGGEREVNIIFVWQENRDDHAGDGIRSGRNTDGDGRANNVDEDDDNDGINDTDGDDCPVGDIDWTSNSSTDNDNDGCQDADEDTDDDNDGLEDNDPIEQLTNSDNVRCSLLADCDNDGLGDNEGDACPAGETNWTSDEQSDKDGDGCQDASEDIDDDGDGLIEIATPAQLDEVRYALDGSGSRSAENAVLDTTGCGGDGGTTCSGYELVADISLATYADDEGGKGWQPLGHDTDSSTNECQGTTFSGTFDGNGWTISDLNISRSGENCVGLFGHVAADTTIRNLSLSAETVMGRIRVGGLVGSGDSARIVSSSIVVEEIIGGAFVGGLMGRGQEARIVYSSVVVGQVSGTTDGGGLIGSGQGVRIDYSSVMAGEVSGETGIGGLVGDGRNGAQIISSSVVVGEVKGVSSIGGLVGNGNSARIISSSVVVGEVSGPSAIGVLTGNFNSGKIAYSYVVSGSDTPALTGSGSGEGVASYWDSDTSGVTSGNHGEAKTSDELQMPTNYTGTIYDSWDDETDIFVSGEDVPLAVWCDRDKSGSIKEAEKIDDNLIWDFGESDEYPAIRCTPIGPTEWRDWWSLNSTGQPELNQMLLNQELNK